MPVCYNKDTEGDKPKTKKEIIKMFEFDIRSKANEYVCDIIYGYSFEDACRRSKLNPEDWHNEGCTYID